MTGNPHTFLNKIWEVSGTKVVLSVILTTTLHGCGGGSETPANETDTEVTRIEIKPAALLLTAAGERQQLTAKAYNASGSEIRGAPIRFESALPAVVSTTADGNVRAMTSLGSTTVTAYVGSISSAAAPITVAEIAPGTLIVNDAQIRRGPQLVLTQPPSGPRQFTVVLDSSVNPTVGMKMMGNGAIPVAGRVTSIQSMGNGSNEVTFSMISLGEAFKNISLDLNLSAEQLSKYVKPTTAQATPLNSSTRTRAYATASVELESTNCTLTGQIDPPNIQVTADINPNLGLKLQLNIQEQLLKSSDIYFHGSLQGNLRGTLAFEAGMTSLICGQEVLSIPVPLGPISALMSPVLNIGTTFTVEANITSGIGFTVNYPFDVDAVIGIRLNADGSSTNINRIDSRNQRLPSFEPVLQLADIVLSITNSVGITADVSLGNPLLKLPSAITAQTGPELSSNWALPYLSAQNPSIEPGYRLIWKSSIGPGEGLQDLISLLVPIAPLDISFTSIIPIATSPTSIERRLTSAKFSTGEAVNFIVKLDSSSAFLFGLSTLYNVDRVSIYRIDEQLDTAILIAESVATDGQIEFAIPWTADQTGDLTASNTTSTVTYHAFMVPKYYVAQRDIFPVELGKIQGPAIRLTPDATVTKSGDSVNFAIIHEDAIDISGAVWTSDGGTIDGTGRFNAGPTPGRYTVRASLPNSREVATATVDIQDNSTPSVFTSFEITPQQLIAGNVATFAAAGANLISGYTVTLPGCIAVETPSLSSTFRQWTCTLQQSGLGMIARLTDPQGNTLMERQITVQSNLVVDGTYSRISAGNVHTCAVTGSGSVRCWGFSTGAQPGEANDLYRKIPVTILGFDEPMVSVASGGGHSCALSIAGRVYCWGYNGTGELGNGTRTSSAKPVLVSGLSPGVRAITAGSNHSCAITAERRAFCWGNNIFGQLGNGQEFNFSTIPVAVAGVGSEVISIDAGSEHTCAADTLGQVKCWGWFDRGRLGNGLHQHTLSAEVAVPPNGGATGVSAGGQHTCAMISDGSLSCWGENYGGAVGDNGAAAPRLSPSRVAELPSPATYVSAGGGHSCALLAGGGLACWGLNGFGQLGSVDAIIARLPVLVTGAPEPMIEVTTGGSHTCAIGLSGAIYCWGYNYYGQLGNNSWTNSSVPIRVEGF